MLVASDNARRRLVVFEDPQCPYCRQFEESSGDLLRREVAAGAVAVEYRMRCLLGPESVRADNALALAAETGRFDELRRELFATQRPEHSGGFTAEDLLGSGRRVGLDDPDYVAGVREGRYEAWVVEVDRRFQEQDPHGTPAALLDGEPVDSSVLYDGQALGNLLRGLTALAPVERVCAAPGTGPEPSRRWDDLVHAQQDGHPARARRTASS